jgi:hypothetical protein
MAAPFRAAASIRLALPARSTDTGEMTVPAPRSAWTRRAGSRHHREPPPRRGRPAAAPGPGRGAALGPQGPGRLGAGAGCQRCRCHRRRGSRPGAGHGLGT